MNSAELKFLKSPSPECKGQILAQEAGRGTQEEFRLLSSRELHTLQVQPKIYESCTFRAYLLSVLLHFHHAPLSTAATSSFLYQHHITLSPFTFHPFQTLTSLASCTPIVTDWARERFNQDSHLRSYTTSLSPDTLPFEFLPTVPLVPTEGIQNFYYIQ